MPASPETSASKIINLVARLESGWVLLYWKEGIKFRSSAKATAADISLAGETGRAGRGGGGSANLVIGCGKRMVTALVGGGVAGGAGVVLAGELSVSCGNWVVGDEGFSVVLVAAAGSWVRTAEGSGVGFCVINGSNRLGTEKLGPDLFSDPDLFF